jgi:hypothetical protein
MTALILDSFDIYGEGSAGVTNMLAGPWAAIGSLTTIGTPSWGAARTGEFCLMNVDNFTSLARRVVPAPGTHFLMSFGFAVDALESGGSYPITFMDVSATALFSIGVLSTGALCVVAGAPPNYSTFLGTSAGPVVVPENWHFFELEVNTGTNTLTLRVDDPAGTGTPVLTVTNAAIAGTLAQFGFLNNPLGSTSTQNNMHLDDLFIRDTNGSVNNGWLGDRRIATLLADADTATMGWSPRYYQKLGAGLLNLTASNACVSAATSTSLNVGSGDYTIETFARFQALPSGSNKAVIFGKWDETANQRSYQLFLGSVALNGGALCLQESTDGTISTVSQPVVYPWTPELDTWYHIALVRSSSELLLFVNGVQLGLPISDSATYFAGSAPMGLGGQVETSGGAIADTTLQGWLDETRFTVGFARYTTNFTPTTVEFPRGSGDAEWADVALLCGFDELIQDESSFGRALTARNGAVQQTVFDGPAVGVWSTVGKAVPDDNTFAEAPYLAATSILTLDAQPAASDTVTVGTKDGSVAAVYTFKTSLSAAFQVLIDTSLQQTLQNLYNAINAGPGSGTKYGTGTTANADVSASQLPAGQMEVAANTLGTAGNAIATSASLTNGGGWTGSTLAGGVDIPGPSNFKVQRPPPQTTVISAVQITQRAFKSDAGTCSVNSGFVGPLGGVTSASAHNLTVSPSYYADIYEEDPDTGASITPATLISGAIQLNRDT